MKPILRSIDQLMPKGLMARAGLLVLLPFLTLQFALLLIFLFAHWQPLTNRLTSAVVNELDLLVTGVEAQLFNKSDTATTTAEEDVPRLVNLPAIQRLGIRAVSLAGPVDLSLNATLPASTLDRKLRRRMRVAFPGRAFTVDINSRPGVVLITVDQKVAEAAEARHYRFIIARERLFSETGVQFMYFILFGGFLILIPSFFFIRNQIRPIRNLAREATAYGRGEAVQDVPVRGAREVRQATQAFRDMRARITRAVDQRTNMLSGVSHDLRTPLTRLKLQLAMMEDTQDRRELTADLAEMEAMLEGYLDYARGNVQEDDRLINLPDLVRQAAEPQKWPGLNIEIENLTGVAVKGRSTALLRLMNNILSNAQRHADQAWISITASGRLARIVVQDNGPGIDPEDFERVLQPFQRLDEGRNLDEAGVGLGLSVCQDIARNHGGRLVLKKAPQGGLEINLELPI